MNNRLAENIKLIRKQKWKLSQDRFASLLDSSRSKINSYENSGVEPSIAFMVKLQRLTGIPVARIFTDPIPIDSIPLEPIVEEQTGPHLVSDSFDIAANTRTYSDFENIVMTRFSALELRLGRMEDSIRSKSGSEG